MHDMDSSDCEHRNQNMKWEPTEIIHTCRLCHATWTTPRRGYDTATDTAE